MRNLCLFEIVGITLQPQTVSNSIDFYSCFQYADCIKPSFKQLVMTFKMKRGS